MSKQPPAAAAAEAEAAASAADPLLAGLDIGKVMSSTGPIVKCVLLRARSCKSSSSANDNASASTPSSSTATPTTIDIDTTREPATMSIKDLKSELKSRNVDTSNFVEKGELITALDEARSNAKAGNAKANADANANANDTKATVTQDDNNDKDGTAPQAPAPATTKEVLLQHLIEEISVDTTPRKSQVSKILGGDFTFLGQYEEEGIMVMIRRPNWETNDDSDDDGEDGNNDNDNDDIPPVNPHALQPPLHDAKVRGDILLMRVAETEEELDVDADENTKGESKDNDNDNNAEEPSSKKINVLTNDEFFLDYTREEYLKFAARTDIVAVAKEEESSSSEEEDSEEEEEGAGAENEEGNNNNEDNSDDGDFDPEADDSDNSNDDDDDSEEHQIGMMNMILSHMLRKFREENGRGPDSLELLEMRKALADRLGVDVPPVDEEAADWDKKSPAASAKKHMEDGGEKRVVVAEEKNETEEIPCRPEWEEVDEGEGENESEEDDDEDVEDVTPVVSRKRPAAAHDTELDVEHDQESSISSTKKARINSEEENHGAIDMAGKGEDEKDGKKEEEL